MLQVKSLGESYRLYPWRDLVFSRRTVHGTAAPSLARLLTLRIQDLSIGTSGHEISIRLVFESFTESINLT